MRNLFFILFLASLATQAQTESIFWKIEHPDIKKPSYLFGTYHLINNGFLDKDAKKVGKIYNKANTIVVESLADEEGEKEAISRHVFSDSSLASALSESDYQLVDSVLHLSNGDDLENYDDFSPIIIAFIIGINHHNNYLEDHGNYNGEPIDLYIQRNALSKSKPVFGLESLDESFGYVIDSINYTNQLNLLINSVKYDSVMYGIAGNMYETYRVNDVKGLLAASNYYDQLIDEIGKEYTTDKRNILWMPRLEKQLKNGNVFVAVGALHLSGEFGLINLLRAEGYQLTPLKIK